jgi:hypothetical protein
VSRPLTLTLGFSLLGACYLLSAVVTAYACSVTNRTIVEAILNDYTATLERCRSSGTSEIDRPVDRLCAQPSRKQIFSSLRPSA